MPKKKSKLSVLAQHIAGARRIVDDQHALWAKLQAAKHRPRVPSRRCRIVASDLPPMRASICEIFVAIAFGTIVYRVQTQISPLERLYRLKDLDDRQAAAAN